MRLCEIMVKAVMFTNEGCSSILFTDYKTYSVGTGYIIVQNENVCYICRVLDNVEYPNYKNKLKRLVLRKKEIEEKVVIVISDKYKSISEAEEHFDFLINKKHSS